MMFPLLATARALLAAISILVQSHFYVGRQADVPVWISVGQPGQTYVQVVWESEKEEGSTFITIDAHERLQAILKLKSGHYAIRAVLFPSEKVSNVEEVDVFGGP